MACAGLTIWGSFAPWVTAFGREVSGFQGDGRLTFWLGVVAVFVIWRRLSNANARGAGWCVMLLAITAIIAIIDAVNVNRVADASTLSFGKSSAQFIQIAWGLQMLLFASIAGTILSFILWRKDSNRSTNQPDQSTIF
jgi:hypothetical protein